MLRSPYEHRVIDVKCLVTVERQRDEEYYRQYYRRVSGRDLSKICTIDTSVARSRHRGESFNPETPDSKDGSAADTATLLRPKAATVGL